jgi:hypothetical protein
MKKRIVFLFSLFMFTMLYSSDWIRDPFDDNRASGTFGTTIRSIVRISNQGHIAEVGDVMIAVINNEIRQKVDLVIMPPGHTPGVGRTFNVHGNERDQPITFYLWNYRSQLVFSSPNIPLSDPTGLPYGNPPTAYYEITFNQIVGSTIRGRVTLEDRETPLSNIIMDYTSALPGYDFHFYKFPFRTNEHGWYAVPGIPRSTTITAFTPVSTDYLFSPHPQTVNITLDVHQFNFWAGLPPSLPISGRVSHLGQGVPGVRISTGSVATITDELGNYEISAIQGSSSILTPSKQGWTFSPPLSVPNIQAPVTGQDFTATPGRFNVSGSLGTTGASITVTSNLLSETLLHTVYSNGMYRVFNVRADDFISIQPFKNEFTVFTPTILTTIPITDSLHNQNFTAEIVQRTISGTVTLNGNPFIGVNIYRHPRNAGDLPLATSTATGFSFTVNHGTYITFFPHREQYRFTPLHQSYDNVTTDILHGVNFVATEIPRHTINFQVNHEDIAQGGVSGVVINYAVNMGATGSTLPTNAAGATSITLDETDQRIVFTPIHQMYNIYNNLSPTEQTIVLPSGINSARNFVLTAHIKTFTVSGNLGVTGATIQVNGITNPNISISNGFFTISGIPFGSTITIIPSHGGYTFVPITIHNITEPVPPVEFDPVPRIFTVRVTVLNTSEMPPVPVPNATVHYELISGTMSGVIATNSQGIATFPATWNQEFDVTVNHPTLISDDALIKQTGPVTNDLINIQFSLRPKHSYTLSGMINLSNGPPVEDVAIKLSVNNAPEEVVTTTNSTGFYTTTIWEGDRIFISPHKVGLQFDNSPGFIQSANGNETFDFVARTAVYQITGQILEGSQPFVGVIVQNGIDETVTGSDGVFRFSIEHGGSVNITPIRDSHYFMSHHTSIPWVINPVIASAHTVFLAHRHERIISGRVVRRGSGLSDVRIFDTISNREVLTNASGDFVFISLHGDEVNLKASKELHSIPDSIYIASIVANSQGHNFWATEHVAPVIFNPPPSITYTAPINISMSTATPGATIRFTRNHTIPDSTSETFSAPIRVGLGDSLRVIARAFRPGFNPSEITDYMFRVAGQLNPPTIHHTATIDTAAIRVTLEAQFDANIYYTLSSAGTDPVLHGILYENEIIVNRNSILRAYATRANMSPSTIVSQVYTINHMMKLDLPDSLFFGDETTVELDIVRYLTDSVTGNHNYVITLDYEQPPQFVTYDIRSNNKIEITSKPNVFGYETLRFKVEYIPEIINNLYSNSGTRGFNVAIDSLVVSVSRNQFPPDTLDRYSFFPVAVNTTTDIGATIDFYVILRVFSSSINLRWYLNEIPQSSFNNDNMFGHTFRHAGQHIVKVVISETSGVHPPIERIWRVQVGTVSEHDEVSEPLSNRLIGNFPNPFNPETNIRFSIANAMNVKISVFNVRGQQVDVLANQVFGAGIHQVLWDARDQSSGIYFVVMQSDDFSDLRKMILIK